MATAPLYSERLSSNRTLALFLLLTVLFFLLALWQGIDGHPGWVGLIFLFLFVTFLFYSVNYRTLVITLSPQALRLRFGLITWTVPRGNIASVALDEVPALMRFGGAGIHFMTIRGRYRASFNFLEYPRLVVAFRRKVGWVRDLSFSTRHPEELLALLQESPPSQVGGGAL